MRPEDVFIPKDSRKLSEFLAKGLALDYVLGALDPDRKASFELALKEFPSLQEEIKRIKSGLEMAKRLQQIELKPQLATELGNQVSYFESLKAVFNIEKMPPALRLSIEGIFIALAVATLAVVIPWNSVLEMNFGPQQVVLSEVVKNSSEEGHLETAINDQGTVQYPDDVNVQKAQQVSGTAQTVSESIPPIAAQTAQVTKGPIAQAPVKPAEKLPETKNLAATPAESRTDDSKAGALYRGTVHVTNFKAVTPKFVEKLQELGGRKAGQVELGWLKGESSYFHFTIPDGKYEEMEIFFKTYGNLVVQRESHERIMPDGIRRVIITVYEKK
jgi:hypothetical protein